MPQFLKWVGSKKWLVPRILPHICKSLTGTYFEPFLGSGAVFFALHPKSAILCDVLEGLISTYQYVKTDPVNLWMTLNKYSSTKVEFHRNRNRFNSLMSHGQYTIETAALFIYLNRAGFNGLWRQNSNGEFNVPWSQNKSPAFPNIGTLIEASKSLRNTILRYIETPDQTLNIIKTAGPGDVVFSDPPYHNTFNDYDNVLTISEDYQHAIVEALCVATSNGATVYAMNSYTSDTVAWYEKLGTIIRLKRFQGISASGERRDFIDELLATNDRHLSNG